MQKEKITDKEAICILIIFITGSILIIGGGGEVENDGWIAAIVATIMAIPMLLIFSRILSLFHGKDLFDILDITLGKIVGKIVAALYIWYIFHLGALVLREFGEFVNTIAMPETPMFLILFCLGIVCIIAAKLGVEVVARICTYFIPLIFFFAVVVELLAISQTHLNYIKPILGNGFIPVLKSGFIVFSFSFAETVTLIGVFNSLKTKNSPFKVCLWALLIAGIILITVTIRNTAILGNSVDDFYFPSYEAVSMIKVSDFIQRIELSVSFAFIFGVFIRSSICLLVVCKGIGKVFNLKDYRFIVIQIGLLMTYFSYTVYNNIIDMSYWDFKVYPYYAFPFQVILPIIIWIFAEIKAKKDAKRIVPKASSSNQDFSTSK